MKRITAYLLCLGMFAAVTAGCAGAGKQITATADEAVNTNVSAYQNTYEDLLTYLSALGYINPLSSNKDITYNEMKADLIGAKQGKRFNAQHTKNTTIELYEYDPNQLDETAQKVIDSVKATGTFQNLFDETVFDVYLTAGGRYMMIYNDPSITDDTKDTDENYQKRQEVVDHFLEFDR